MEITEKELEQFCIDDNKKEQPPKVIKIGNKYHFKQDECFFIFEEGYLTCTKNHKIGEDCLLIK